jgi:UDP-N-acetylmuramoyl-tripeptide--D-alanyl-D-alanine ligase
MMRPDPFFGYSIILRAIVFGLVPAFAVLQLFRVRRALHVFQLEGYKRDRFLDWCRRNRDRSLFLRSTPQKKPLVMTGRAWRILVTALVVTVVGLLVPAGFAHLVLGGFPMDIITWAVMTIVLFFGLPYVVVASDWLLTPVQAAVNGRYLRAARRKLEEIDPVVVGITGSFGKTSTKFAIERLVASPEAVLATPASFNTTMGVCRAVNERLTARHRFFVVEMGARRRGDIAELCRLVHPRIGVLTSIGPAHLETFGSLEAIRATKYELVEGLQEGGTAVMNVDDEEVRGLADLPRRVDVVRYGLDPSGRPDITASGVEVTPGGTIFTVVDTRSGASMRATTRLLGRHALGHVLAAVAVALAAGRSLEELEDAIAGLAPVEHRLQIIEGTGGVTVIDDAFNSNPEGAEAALDVLDAMPGRRKVVVTPGMIELGPLQPEANERFGEHAGRVADTVIVVSRTNRAAISSGAARNGTAQVITVDSLTEAQQHLKGLLASGDVVLFENDLPDHYEG